MVTDSEQMNMDVSPQPEGEQLTMQEPVAEATEQPDHSLRAIEEGVFQEWGEGERADPHGVEIFSDAAATI